MARHKLGFLLTEEVDYEDLLTIIIVCIIELFNSLRVILRIFLRGEKTCFEGWRTYIEKVVEWFVFATCQVSRFVAYYW